MLKQIPFIKLVCIFLVSVSFANAQVLPVGSHLLEEYYRQQQLLGKLDSTVSFVIRPLQAKFLRQDNIYRPNEPLNSPYQYSTGDDQIFLQILPITWEVQANSSYPYGWNDGSMIPSNGFQTRLSAGVYAQYKFLSVQFRPEFVYADNKTFENHAKQPGFGMEWYHAIGNHIDMPEYFGNGSYQKAFFGQSNILFTFKPISFGLSTENLWWGPGKRNSLTMSNTAPGFMHATIHTSTPIATPIGSFEAQIVGGKLNRSGFPPSITGESLHQELYYVEKPDDWRYFSGFVANYQPKWVPGLFLGFIRTYVTYHKDQDKLQDYLPFFSPSLSGTDYLDDNGVKQQSNHVRDRYGSVFFRWVMPSGGFEVYGEYGRKLKAENGRDWMVNPTKSRAYILGFTKMVSLHRASGANLQISAEATELASPDPMESNYTASWYTDDVVRDGYTNKGQVLGAGIGPGSDLQSIDVSWIRDLQSIGIEFERFSHNEDFFNHYVRDIRRSWADLGIRGHASWDYKQFVATASFQYTHAYNYQHIVDEFYSDFWDYAKHDKNNVNFRLGISYRF
ncbi:Capsule assembly protein Wzi [bacterium A37T11]|nr:Capsule assembly protein Wzi [bacterium A37T11]